MLYKGTLKLNGEDYTTYRINLKGYRRLDIMNEGGIFHTGFQDLLYSNMARRKMWQFGDVGLFADYEDLVNSPRTIKTNPVIETKWENGKFLYIASNRIDDDHYIQEKRENNVLIETVIKWGENLFIEVCSDKGFNTKLEPTNRSQFVEVSIDKVVTESNIIGDYIPLSILEKRKDLSWIGVVDYEVVSDVGLAREWVKYYSQLPVGQYIGFDFETTSTLFTYGASGDITGIVLSHAPDKSRYFPFYHVNEDNNLPLEILRELLEATRHLKQVAHLKRFDQKVLIAKGYGDYDISDDSFLASFINDPDPKSRTHGLKYLAELLTGRSFLELTDIFINQASIDFSRLDYGLTKVYACPDADNSVKVLKDELSKMPDYTKPIYDLECKLATVKADQEYWGIRVNMEDFYSDYTVCKETMDTLEELIKRTARTNINLNSGDQLSTLLYHKLKCPVLVRTDTGKPSTGVKALDRLAKMVRPQPVEVITGDLLDSRGNLVLNAKDLNKAKYPTILFLKAYREYSKLFQAFYTRLERENERGRYYFWMNAQGTATGRQSSPLHQLPDTIRKRMLADSEDHIIVDTDYKQMELRILASVAGEVQLIRLMRDPDIDIHRAILSRIRNLPIHMISQEMRQGGKRTNFGVVYMIGPYSLAEQEHGASPTKEQVTVAADAIAEFYRTFKRIAIKNEQSRDAILRDRVIYTSFNRPRKFERLQQEGLSKGDIEAMIRAGINMPIQGTGADITKQGEVNLAKYIKRKGWDELVDTPQGRFPKVRLMATIHDEYLLSVHKSLAKHPAQILKMLKDCTEFHIDDWAPLYIGTHFVDTWAEGGEDRYEIPNRLADKIIEEDNLILGDDLKGDMLKVIQEFRVNDLSNWMEEVIAEVGTSLETLVTHIDHPSLTHELINRFGPSYKHEQQHGTMSHMDRIRYATEEYLNYRETDKEHLLELLSAKDREGVEQLRTNTDEFIQQGERLLDDIYDFDLEGNVIDEAGYILDHDSAELVVEVEEEVYSEMEFAEAAVVIELINQYYIDLGIVKETVIEEVTEIVKEYQTEDSVQSVVVLWGDSHYDLGIHVANLPVDEITKLVQERQEEFKELY